MNPEKKHLYKQERQTPPAEEAPAHRKKSKTASVSSSRKRSDHRHVYRKIILHYGGDAFCWGRQCELCGRIDSMSKASGWSPQDFAVTGVGLSGNWRDICLTEIHRRYPEYPIMTLDNAQWQAWPADRGPSPASADR